ncbi:MAG: MATE family efflux transporter [Candidatus Spyradocola sp.]|nr:MATE family efflux transporter [Candidatus Spyradocola sp.]
MQEGLTRENKMGVMPVGKLLMSMSLPIMISMLIQALYNIVDSMFAARISEDALTAVSLAFPIQNLMIAVATGTGVGMNSLLSKALGAKDFDRANRAATNGLFVLVLSCVPFMLFGGLLTDWFMRTQTDIESIILHGDSYLRVVCLVSVGAFGAIAVERLLQATGKTVYSMITQAVGAVVNIALDPVLIFGLCGLPAMGVTGAAVATVISQCVSFVLGIVFNVCCNREISLSYRGFRPDGHIIGRIYAVGVPSILMASIGSVMTFFMNRILIAFSSTATAVLGVYFKLQSFIFMPIFGLNNGLVPIVSYNYGAKKKKRMMRSIKLAILTALCIMAAGFLAFELIPDQLMGLYNASEHMLSIGEPALRIIGIHFLIAGYCIVAGSVFQALGNALPSLITSLARQLVVLLPVAWLLAQTGNVNNVWWAFPIAEVMSAAMTTLFFVREYRAKIKPLPEE